MKPTESNPLWSSLLLFAIIASSFNVGLAETGTEFRRDLVGNSPFTAKASLLRYWKKKVTSTNLPSSFFLNKASPLDAVQLAMFSEIAGKQRLPAQLSGFCKAADLLCFPDVATSHAKDSKDVNFAEYKFQNFTNYGTGRHGGVDSFKNYTNNETFPIDTFRRYSRDSAGHDDQFTNYALTSLIANDTFNSYGTKSTGGTGDFINYQNGSTIAGLNFTSYSDSTDGRTQDFTSYATNATVGNEGFISYGKNGNRATNDFSIYGNNTPGITSFFNNYDEASNHGDGNFTSYGLDERIPENHFSNYAGDGNGTTETFTAYGRDGNIPINDFNTYGSGGSEITQKFENYGDLATTGENQFISYAENSKTQSLGFTNYGHLDLTDTFKEYGKGSQVKKVDFNTYGLDNTFSEYTKKGVVTFNNYLNQSASGTTKNQKMRVEPGKFFREKLLRTGTVMPMPDIKDKMPKRSFLPRTILSKLPFSTNKMDELKRIFQAADASSMTRIMGDALRECERAPSPGETKRCAGSGEDMIDFATSVLGRNIIVRNTENTQGSGGDIMIGKVTGINGGQITKSVSCHQSLYPYLLYYCHSVPKVRVYEADILDPKSKTKINHGVAICHVDTSSWSPNHGAFIALGPGPGKIEVCHWIFENDMTWTISA